MKRLSLCLLAAALLLTACTPADPTPAPDTSVAAGTPSFQLEASDLARCQAIVDSENAWLAGTQLSNGALPMRPSDNATVKVTPYFADFAALSMLNQAELYADNVKKYMDWHFSHLNTAQTDHNGVDGTIYDYNVTVRDGVVEKEEILIADGKNSYDSTDSYAATFLMVLQKYVEKTDDKQYILDHKDEIQRIVGALFATMVDGLTLAKPDYEVKYLMDNCEVYEGMLAGEKLYSNVLVPADKSLSATRDKLKNGAREVANCIELEMWGDGFYHPALDRDSAVAWDFDWNDYYPSATAQTFPIIHGLISPTSERARALYDGFCAAYAWETYDIPDNFIWGSNVYTAVLMGDVDRANTYLTRYEKVMKKHAYPLYNSDAAKVAMAAYYLLQL